MGIKVYCAICGNEIQCGEDYVRIEDVPIWFGGQLKYKHKICPKVMKVGQKSRKRGIK